LELADLGWNPFFEESFFPYQTLRYSPLLIFRENRKKYIGRDHNREYICEVTGKFRFDNRSQSNFPTVGDWVAATIIQNEGKAFIHAVLPRKSVFSRKEAGEKTDERRWPQISAAEFK